MAGNSDLLEVSVQYLIIQLGCGLRQSLSFLICFRYKPFLFLDEFSTAGIEIFAEINDKTSKHIRENNTWSLRKVGNEISKRPFGGLNVVVSGDAWQFGPIGSVGAVFDNPTRMRSSAVTLISQMFLLEIMEP